MRVLFDDRSLYIGIVAVDSQGARDLRVRDLRRDFDDTIDDYVGVAIDGVQDGRSAMVFRVNSRGALGDQQTVDGGLADVDFDAVWTAGPRATSAAGQRRARFHGRRCGIAPAPTPGTSISTA